MNHRSSRAWVIAPAKLWGALALLTLAAGAVGAQAGSAPAQQGRSSGRGYVARKYLLETSSGPKVRTWLFSVEGGHATANVVAGAERPEHIRAKQIAGVKYEDISLRANPEDVAGFLKEVMARRDRMNGKIVSANFDYKEESELDFFNALPTEIGLPPFEAASKEACYVSLTLAPEFTRSVTMKAGPPVGAGPSSKGPERACLRSDFAVAIDGLPDGSRHVTSVDGIVLKRKGAGNPAGALPSAQARPTAWEFSNITLTVPESHAQEFAEWHKRFVIEGNDGPQKEKTMTVTLLSPGRTHVLLELHASHVGILKFTPEKVEAGSENIRRVKVELYVRNWEVVGPL